MIFMNWKTIYLIGNDNFFDDVNKKLAQSDVVFLPGIIEQRPDKKYQGLYWVDTHVDLRTLKEAISGKLIWKYRLNFFNEIEPTVTDQITEPESDFSDKENAMIKSMRAKDSLAA